MAVDAGMPKDESRPKDESQGDGARGASATGSARPLDPTIVTLRSVGVSRAQQDAALLEAVRDVTESVRLRVLEHMGLVGVDLTKTQKRTVDAEAKKLAAAEVEVALGFGVTEAGQSVAVATSAGDLLSVLLDALRRGGASWGMVRRFCERASRLTDAQRMLVALALFGVDPALAAEERLDCDGALINGPWPQSLFQAALDREVTACEGEDARAEKERRRRAYAKRRAGVRVHDDGTATLTVTGPALTIVALGQRIDRAARLLRKAGDPRTLDQLRCDVVCVLLIFGVVRLPGSDTTGTPTTDGTTDSSTGTTATSTSDSTADSTSDADGDGTHDPSGHDGSTQDDAEDEPDDLIAPDDLEHLVRVINALPTVHLQVVVPQDALKLGHLICTACAAQMDAAGVRRPDDHPAQSPGDSCATPPSPSPPFPSPSFPSPDEPPRAGPPGRGLAAEVLGPHSFFITPGHARELALFPGTTLFRLLADPADGRLVERTISAYRPDADMRRQVIAADVLSRAPGPRLGAHAGELDHVTPYGWAGGRTTELNLALLAKRPHQFKTIGAWRAAMTPRRDVTITTVLGQVATSRVHDYRQYLHVREPEDVEDRRDLANRLTYALLAEQPEHRYGIRRPGETFVTLTHTDEDGRTRRGPGPHHPTADDLLGPEDAA